MPKNMMSVGQIPEVKEEEEDESAFFEQANLKKTNDEVDLELANELPKFEKSRVQTTALPKKKIDTK